MNKARKIGIVLLLVGFCLPFAAFPLVDNYSPHESIMTNIAGMEIVLKEQKLIVNGDGLKIEERKSIQYRHIFLLGVVLVFTGAGFIQG
jgi:hypothetical protein